MKDPIVCAVRIEDQNGKLLYEKGRPCWFSWEEIILSPYGESLGRLKLYFSLKPLRQSLEKILALSLGIAGGLGLPLLLAVVFWQSKRSVKPLREIARRLQEGGYLEDLPEKDRPDEVGVLARALLERDHRLKSQTQELELLFRAIEQSHEVVVITDNEGIIQYVNPAFERITGYLRKEALGKKPSIVKSGKHPPEFYRNLWQTILSGKTWEGTFINRRKNGEEYLEMATISPVKDSQGRITHFIATKKDITQERRLEAALREAQKLEALGTMAGGLAHQLNNLFMALKSRLELISLKPESLPKDLEILHHLVDQGSHLIRELLLFARRQALSLEPLSLQKTLEELLRTFRGLIRENIEILTDWRAQQDRIQGSREALKQILLNLLLNAQEVMPQGGRIFLRTYNQGDRIVLEVEDTGPGIPEKIQKRIFEPFFTTKPFGQGTGLGLSVVYGLVKAHRGEIEVESPPERGALFRLSFPLTSEDVRETSSPGPRKGPLPQRILLIEDEDEVRENLKALLEMEGARVLTAATLEEARKILETPGTDIQVVISDEMLPDGRGHQFLKELLKERPGIKGVLMSGYLEEKPNLYSDFKFLPKPFSLEDLKGILYDRL